MIQKGFTVERKGRKAAREMEGVSLEWETGLARNMDNGKIPLNASYRAGIFPLPWGKLHSSPCPPAELRA